MTDAPPIRLHIDVTTLSIGAQLDFEAAQESKSLTALCAWLVDHAGADIDELRQLNNDEFLAVFKVIAAELAKLQPSKSNGVRSSPPSRGAKGARQSGRTS